jgi:hypothetical protein
MEKREREKMQTEKEREKEAGTVGPCMALHSQVRLALSKILA